MPKVASDSPLDARDAKRVGDALRREYGHLVPTDDLPEATDNPDRLNRLLSRSLAAIALRHATKLEREEAARHVIDGADDQGIDAIAVTDGGSRLTVVQAKWSNKGRAILDTTAALKLVEGLRLLDERSFDRFNQRFQELAPVVLNAFKRSDLEIELVIALMGERVIGPSAKQILDDACAGYNHYHPELTYSVFGAADAMNQLREDAKPPSVDISAYLDQWLHEDGPQEQYVGWIAGNEAASWFADHGSTLFTSNLRGGLGRTSVNDAIMRTLAKDPTAFSQHNNGLTILCASAEPIYLGSRRSRRDPITLQLKGASIINGAQTLSAVHRVWREHPDVVAEANILATIVVIGSGQERAAEITESRNTQNHVLPRDLRALDPFQVKLWEDFTTYLQKTYTYKRGEPAPAPDAGCSLDEAATALACAYRNAELSFRAKSNFDTLWEVGEGGAYTLLFSGEPSAQQVWNIVLVHRLLAAALAKKKASLVTRPSEIADRVDQLVIHIAFQLIDLEMDGDEVDSKSVSKTAKEKIDVALNWFLYHFDMEFSGESYLSPILNSESSCLRVAALAIASARQGSATPTVGKKYRKKKGERRPNTVPMLVTHGLIPEGAELRFLSPSTAEQVALLHWLSEDPGRLRATWVPDRRKCLLWAYDGERYSPTALVNRIWELAGWDKAPVAVQGPARWLYGKKTLAAIAEDFWRDQQN